MLRKSSRPVGSSIGQRIDEGCGVVTNSNGDTPTRLRERLVRHGTVDLAVARRINRTHWATVLVATGLGAIAASTYLHLAHWKYSVRLYITAAKPTAQAGGTLSALSSLAGLSAGAAGNPKFAEFLAAIRSPVAAEAIVKNQAMLRLMFPQDWSVREGRWREPRSFLRPVANVIRRRVLGMPAETWAPPEAPQVYRFLRDNLKVIPDAKSGVVALELDTLRPVEAKGFLVNLNESIDDWMRQHELRHASMDIDYLSRQLTKTTVEEVRAALVTNLTDQEKLRMLASAPLPYVSDMLGEPIVSATPVNPKPIPVLFAGIVFGYLIGFFIAVRKYGRR